MTRRRLALAAAALVSAATLACSRREEPAEMTNAELAGKAELPVLPGRTAEQRERIRPGMSSKELLSTLGHPALPHALAMDASVAKWTYPYADGKLEITLHYGYVQTIETDFK